MGIKIVGLCKIPTSVFRVDFSSPKSWPIQYAKASISPEIFVRLFDVLLNTIWNYPSQVFSLLMNKYKI